MFGCLFGKRRRPVDQFTIIRENIIVDGRRKKKIICFFITRFIDTYIDSGSFRRVRENFTRFETRVEEDPVFFFFLYNPPIVFFFFLVNRVILQKIILRRRMLGSVIETIAQFSGR